VNIECKNLKGLCMKHMSSEKARITSSVAWFKLAEVITRGEKERALSIYRLLMHSIPSEAIKAQLEGDILDIFNDGAAVYAYSRAAELYQKNHEDMQAFLLYEIIVSLLLTQQEHLQAYVIVRDSTLKITYKMTRYEQLIVGMLTSDSAYDALLLKQVIAAVIKGYQNAFGKNDDNSGHFLAKLAALDEKAYTYACEQVLIA
jgi:hypothetical protein